MVTHPSKKPRQRLSPEDRYTQLLGIALDLNARKGVGRVGHGDIAKAANVSTGTVFNYFPTLDALNADVLKSVGEQVLALFNDRPDGDSPATILMFYSFKLFDLIEAWPALCKVFFSWSQSFDDPFRKQFLALKKEILGVIISILRERDTAQVDAHIIYGTAVLYAQMKFEGYPNEELTALASRVTELIA